jgi:hypothetical protein
VSIVNRSFVRRPSFIRSDTGDEYLGMGANGAGFSALMEYLNGGHRLDLGVWGRRCVRCLLSQPIAEGVIAEEGHDTDFAVETL